MGEPMNTPPGAAHWRIAVAGPMTIYEAAPGKRALLEALGRGVELEIDLSGVTELDTAGIQLLLLVKREASTAHKIVRLTAPRPAALDEIDLCGLGGHLMGTSESDGSRT